jgi:uncharacterized membrane protein YjdF
MLFFVFVIFYSVATDYKFYIFDALLSIFVVSIFFIFYDRINLDKLSFALAILGFLLHDLGAFRFYAEPPIPLRWDVVTHLIGIFAASVVAYKMIYEKFEKNPVMLFSIVILAALGVGVLIELIEFGGVLKVGLGEGVLGRGDGDLRLPFWMSADYLDTLIDQIINFSGALLGFVFSRFWYKTKKLKKGLKK